MIRLPTSRFSSLLHLFFFSSRRRHTRSLCDWSSDVCSSDLVVFRDRVMVRANSRDNHSLVATPMGLLRCASLYWSRSANQMGCVHANQANHRATSVAAWLHPSTSRKPALVVRGRSRVFICPGGACLFAASLASAHSGRCAHAFSGAVCRLADRVSSQRSVEGVARRRDPGEGRRGFQQTLSANQCG